MVDGIISISFSLCCVLRYSLYFSFLLSLYCLNIHNSFLLMLALYADYAISSWIVLVCLQPVLLCFWSFTAVSLLLVRSFWPSSGIECLRLLRPLYFIYCIFLPHLFCFIPKFACSSHFSPSFLFTRTLMNTYALSHHVSTHFLSLFSLFMSRIAEAYALLLTVFYSFIWSYYWFCFSGDFSNLSFYQVLGILYHSQH